MPSPDDLFVFDVKPEYYEKTYHEDLSVNVAYTPEGKTVLHVARFAFTDESYAAFLAKMAEYPDVVVEEKPESDVLDVPGINSAVQHAPFASGHHALTPAQATSVVASFEKHGFKQTLNPSEQMEHGGGSDRCKHFPNVFRLTGPESIVRLNTFNAWLTQQVADGKVTGVRPYTAQTIRCHRSGDKSKSRYGEVLSRRHVPRTSRIKRLSDWRNVNLCLNAFDIMVIDKGLGIGFFELSDHIG